MIVIVICVVLLGGGWRWNKYHIHAAVAILGDDAARRLCPKKVTWTADRRKYRANWKSGVAAS